MHRVYLYAKHTCQMRATVGTLPSHVYCTCSAAERRSVRSFYFHNHQLLAISLSIMHRTFATLLLRLPVIYNVLSP